MGKVIKQFEDDISTDIIYPGRFMATVLPSETPEYAFADDTELNRKLRTGDFNSGDIILGGQNFGSGSSREQAASTLKGHKLVIVAKGFSRIFLQNSINLGLQTVACPEIEASEGDELEVSDSLVMNKTTGRQYAVRPLPEARKSSVEAGGLIPYTRKRLMGK